MTDPDEKLSRRKFIGSGVASVVGAGLGIAAASHDANAAPQQPPTPPEEKGEKPQIKEYRKLGRTGYQVSDLGFGNAWGWGAGIWGAPCGGLYHWRRGNIHPRSLGYRFNRPNRQVDVRFGGQRSILRVPTYDLEPSHAVSRPHKMVDVRFGGQRTIWQVPAYDIEPMQGR